MSRAARIVTMWVDESKVHVSLRGDGEGDDDLLVRLDVVLARVLQAGATHLVVHLDRLTGDPTAVVDHLADACQQLWVRHGVMETVGLRGRLAAVPGPREAPDTALEGPHDRGRRHRATTSPGPGPR
jgi:hypothetical protein